MLLWVMATLLLPVSNVEPIPPYEGEDERGQVMIFVGQGDTGTGLTGPTTADGQLRAATNRVERVESDMLVFRFDAPEEEGVTPLEGISGPGDSGGPVLLETDDGWRLAGLSVAQDSAGRERGTYGVWEFYTRVSWYAPWIEETIEQTPLVADPMVVDEQMPLEEAPVETGQIRWVLYLSLAAVILLGGLMVIGGMVWRMRRRP